ncbi:Redoxin-domain-containing protein [Suillus paluster]|uniref:Redoxin-domain-containing protein n=1 Tax=Suillus paluster TaxID=48578 RepID=UPI001B865C4F|nr:Redoxin-domain-containing protein [Suillus paluster]KAG1750636.1 Redoxin-domain-containing protein [Suillus paluster]
MASILTNVAQAAHSAAATVLSAAQIEAGELISQKPVKEEDPERSITLDLSGKNIILGVPGAFTPPCSSQVPQYIADYDKFKAKGVNNIYVVAVNDAFVVKAWKEKLAPQGTGVRFIADDKGEFTSGVGLLFDASGLLGAPRSKRYVIVAQDGKVDFLAVEEQPANITVTAANLVLAQL